MSRKFQRRTKDVTNRKPLGATGSSFEVPSPESDAVENGSDVDEFSASAASQEFLRVPPMVPSPFTVDPAQEEARGAIRTGDTIFIAPTGYGKSWVAYEAARDTVDAGGRVYYTTPLKALSNQKLLDLVDRFGPDRVGIITGDRRENPSASIIVLTTEILRAMLLSGDTLAPADASSLIVLDECHWLADPERGTTWEEVILLAPRSARLLLLSASVGNGDQVAGWLEEVRGRRPRLLQIETRAVPQRWGVWHNGTILPLREAIDRNRASGHSPPWPRVLEVLKREGLTPALVFVPTRRMCNALTDQCASVDGAVVRAHHGGMMLADRLSIERELQAGAIDVVFSTTTLASGIDAPVKTVVIGTLDDGRGRPIPATVIQQMAGRAGRRGRDSVGFVIVIAPTARDLTRIDGLRRLPPDRIDSAFSSTYQTVLRLIVRRGLPGAMTFASGSFASYQSRGLITHYRSLVERYRSDLDGLRAKLEPRSCDDPGVTWPKFVTAEDRYSASRGSGELNRLRDGYLCVHGIAFPKNQKKIKQTLILSPGGTLVQWPFVPSPIAEDASLEREVQDLIRTLLNTPAGGATVGQWFAFGTPGGARSIEKVSAIQGERVSFGGEGTYLLSRLSGKRVHALDPTPFGPRVAELLARAAATLPVSETGPESDSVPCRHCPALDRCSDHVQPIQSSTELLRSAQNKLVIYDPEARTSKIVNALQKLGALDRDNCPTELGRALLATHDRSGLFFALARERLGRLSPERLALVVAATRDVRVGFIPCPTDLLPGFYPNEVNGAFAAEAAAGGVDSLANLAEDAEREPWSRPRIQDRSRWERELRSIDADPDRGEDDDDGEDAESESEIGNRPSFADRRAYVFKRLWSARPVDAVGIAPGDAERLFLDTLATLHDLREISELRESAAAAIEHLRTIAGGGALL